MRGNQTPKLCSSIQYQAPSSTREDKYIRKRAPGVGSTLNERPWTCFSLDQGLRLRICLLIVFFCLCSLFVYWQFTTTIKAPMMVLDMYASLFSLLFWNNSIDCFLSPSIFVFTADCHFYRRHVGGLGVKKCALTICVQSFFFFFVRQSTIKPDMECAIKCSFNRWIGMCMLAFPPYRFKSFSGSGSQKWVPKKMDQKLCQDRLSRNKISRQLRASGEKITLAVIWHRCGIVLWAPI